MNGPLRAILGVGNVLLSDEGVGVHAVRALLARGAPEGVLILDGGTAGLGLMEAIVGLRRLVIVDCVRGGLLPGTITCFDWGEAGTAHLPPAGTAHDTTLADVLAHVALVATPPRTTVIGVEPASLAMGLSLTSAVGARLAEICDLALARVAEG